MYMFGRGVPINRHIAKTYFEKAAKKGHYGASIALRRKKLWQ